MNSMNPEGLIRRILGALKYKNAHLIKKNHENPINAEK
jgi:hypothetical protein